MSDNLNKCFEVLVKQINEDVKSGFIEIIKENNEIHLNIIDPIGLTISHSNRIKEVIKRIGEVKC